MPEPTAATCKTLQFESLSNEQEEQYAAFARVWPTLCQGDDLESHLGELCAEQEGLVFRITWKYWAV
jgi:hypothetical protein